MRNLMIPMALVAGLAFGSTAFAAVTSTSHPTAKPAATAPAATTKSAANEKQQACSKTWQGQKHHVGARKDFMRSCVAKG